MGDVVICEVPGCTVKAARTYDHMKMCDSHANTAAKLDDEAARDTK